MKNLVIVGGGTAGWITALNAKKNNTDSKVILIESEELGILGAGEGATPHLPYLMLGLGIEMQEIFKECGATVKNGIKFTNWNSEKDFYYSFHSYGDLGEQTYSFPIGTSLKTSLSAIIAAKKNEDIKDYSLVSKMCNENLVPMHERGCLDYTDLIEGLAINADWSIHFDARKLAKFLRKVGESRGIIRVEGIVKDFETDSQGYITSILTDKDNIDVDFVFDCTGFRRLIIGKFYNSQWNSYKDFLPANKAVAFFLPMTEKIPTYTESIAMNFGWMWKIPTQERFGCGYVFDDNFITEEDAKKELNSFFKEDLKFVNTFSFEAGCYKTPWVKNVLAVGLSAGFLEPLEATSIWQSSKSIHRFLSVPSNLDCRNQDAIDQFNRLYVKETESIVSFLYLHYVTNKKNNKFWADFTKNNKMPELVDFCLKVSKERPLFNELDFIGETAFSEYDYTMIMVGNGLTDTSMFKEYKIPNHESNIDKYEMQKINHLSLIPLLLNHREFLDYCKKIERGPEHTLEDKDKKSIEEIFLDSFS